MDLSNHNIKQLKVEVKISQQRQFDTYKITIDNHIYVHYCHDKFKYLICATWHTWNCDRQSHKCYLFIATINLNS